MILSRSLWNSVRLGQGGHGFSLPRVFEVKNACSDRNDFSLSKKSHLRSYIIPPFNFIHILKYAKNGANTFFAPFLSYLESNLFPVISREILPANASFIFSLKFSNISWEIANLKLTSLANSVSSIIASNEVKIGCNF